MLARGVKYSPFLACAESVAFYMVRRLLLEAGARNFQTSTCYRAVSLCYSEESRLFLLLPQPAGKVGVAGRQAFSSLAEFPHIGALTDILRRPAAEVEVEDLFGCLQLHPAVYLQGRLRNAELSETCSSNWAKGYDESFVFLRRAVVRQSITDEEYWARFVPADGALDREHFRRHFQA
eukprot:s935_g12.t1